MPRLVIDTDTAIDDSIALIMALRNPAVTVDAITVVAGNVPLDVAVQNALYCVDFCGADVPVHAGAAEPIMRELETAEHIHGSDGLGDSGIDIGRREPAPGRAVDVLVDRILDAPGEITLLAIGPLTNVAIAFLRAPEIATALDRLVIMGGTGVDGPGNASALAEYNFWADPEAARIVMRSEAPVELVGWDVSLASANMTKERAEAIDAVGSKYSDFCLAIQANLMAFVEDIPMMGVTTLPDPIAMAHAIDPSVAETAFMPVGVIAGDGGGRGVMEIDRMGFSGATPNATVVTAYPEDHFFAMLIEALTE